MSYELEARIHPGAGSLRWIVTSRTRPEIEHIVDLEAYSGNGRCSCEHFEFRIGPDLRDGRRRTGGTRCSHILVARNAFCDAMIQCLSRSPGGSPGDQQAICPECGDGIETPGAPRCSFCTEIQESIAG